MQSAPKYFVHYAHFTMYDNQSLFKQKLHPGTDPGFSDGWFVHAKCTEIFCSLRSFYLSYSFM